MNSTNPTFITGNQVTATHMNNLRDAVNSKAEIDSIADTNSIPFTQISSVIADHIMSAPLVITPNTTGAVAGCGAIQRIIADGVNVPDFSAFSSVASASFYDNTAGKVNIFLYFYDGANYNVAIQQNGVFAGVDPAAVTSAWVTRLASAGYTISSPRQTAYQNFVSSLISNGLYPLIKEMWLFEGGTAATNVLGFKNLYTATIGGTLTHNANGTTGDGSTGYMNLGVTGDALGSGPSNMHVAVAVRNTLDSTTATILGAYGNPNYLQMSPRMSGSSFFSLAGPASSFSISSTSKKFIMSRNTTIMDVTVDGTTTSSTIAGGVTSIPINLYAFGFNNNGSLLYPSDNQISFISLGLYLTPTQSQLLNTLLNTLFTALGR